MTKTLATLLVAAVAFGSASASSAFAEGEYYNGASATPLFQVALHRRPVRRPRQQWRRRHLLWPAHRAIPSTNVSTGSVVRGAAPQSPVENGDYYPGLSR